MSDYQLEEISIELSNRCLMQCIMCSSGSTPKAYPNELHPGEINRIMREARELGATTISFSGGDPILLGCHLVEYIKDAHRLRYERILLYTTGLTDVCSKSFVETPLHFGISTHMLRELVHIRQLVIIFSLHSHRPEVNDYIMGREGAFRLIIGNISMCKDLGFQVWVHMVPMLPNWRHARQVHYLCNRLGVSKMSMLRFVPQTRGADANRALSMTVKEFAEMQIMMDEMAEYHNVDSHMQHTELRYGCPIEFRHTVCDDYDRKLKPCHAGTDLILVRPRGDVHPCAAWKSLPETDNVRDKSLADIWENGVVFQALRHYREEGWKTIKGVCTSCKYQSSCKSGCPAQRMHAFKLIGMRPDSCIDDLYIDTPDPLCPVGHNPYVYMR
jgi:radical SAM protein with 4Fe4S-binding SPASM domain